MNNLLTKAFDHYGLDNTGATHIEAYVYLFTVVLDVGLKSFFGILCNTTTALIGIVLDKWFFDKLESHCSSFLSVSLSKFCCNNLNSQWMD